MALNLSEEIANTIIQSRNLETLWDTYNSIILNMDNLTESIEEEYHQVKTGVCFKFHIQEILQKKYKDRSKTGSITFLRGNRLIPYEAFYDEIDARKAIMIKTIYENISQKAPITPRGMN